VRRFPPVHRGYGSAAGAVGVIALVVLAAPGASSAQSVGAGASPGRAAYRPEVEWNTGPYYTVPHVNPYLPHQRTDNFLMDTDAPGPPYNTAPRGHYDAFSPARGDVYPYAEGFSPYSGYANWYKRTNNFRPTEDDVKRATQMYFRSGGPRVGVVSPAQAADIHPAPNRPTAAPTRPAEPTMKTYTTPSPQPRAAGHRTAIYRGSVGP
jgi:hypothetical protein